MRWVGWLLVGASITAASAYLAFDPDAMPPRDGRISGKVVAAHMRTSPRGFEGAGWLSYVADDRHRFVVRQENALDGLALRVGGRELSLAPLLAGGVVSMDDTGVVLQSGTRLVTDTRQVDGLHRDVAKRFEKALAERDVTLFIHVELRVPMGAWATVRACRDGEQLVPCGAGSTVHVSAGGEPASRLVAAVAMVFGIALMAFGAVGSSPLPLFTASGRRGG
ncbi:MAG: hypothetical protein JRI68_09205 [Deltaproteobacteria bacterium]|nr:hypothetical protein [Deltaproteobacteria bacterium]